MEIIIVTTLLSGVVLGIAFLLLYVAMQERKTQSRAKKFKQERDLREQEEEKTK